MTNKKFKNFGMVYNKPEFRHLMLKIMDYIKSEIEVVEAKMLSDYDSYVAEIANSNQTRKWYKKRIRTYSYAEYHGIDWFVYRPYSKEYEEKNWLTDCLKTMSDLFYLVKNDSVKEIFIDEVTAKLIDIFEKRLTQKELQKDAKI